MTGMAVPLLLVAAAALAALGTWALRHYAEARAILDVPNERSLHSTPTPRGGGIVIAVGVVAAIAALGLSGRLASWQALALAGVVPVAVTGWIDDRRSLTARTRLLAQLAGAGWTVAWLGGFPRLAVGEGALTLGLAGSALAVVTIVWLTNLYNFMDGIDGLAGAEALVAGGTVAAILWLAGAPGLALVAGVLAATAAGFLVLNWAPAKIFMGDVGSTTVGFTFAALAFTAERAGHASALVLLLPVAVFIADATYTLVRRGLRGERVFDAHRSHVYQQLVQRGWSHRRVSTLVVVIDLALAAAAWLAWRHPSRLGSVMAATVLALVATAAVALAAARRAPAARGAPNAGD